MSGMVSRKLVRTDVQVPNTTTLDRLLGNRVDLDAPTEHSNALRVMVRALNRQLSSMPAFLIQPINKAASFLIHEASEQELLDERIRLWRYLDERGHAPSDTEYGATRAVICALFPPSQDSEPAGDTLAWFLEFWDRACLESAVAAEALEFVYGRAAKTNDG